MFASDDDQQIDYRCPSIAFVNLALLLRCVKSVHIRSYSRPYSVRMWENMDQNTSEYGHFLHSILFNELRQANNETVKLT